MSFNYSIIIVGIIFARIIYMWTETLNLWLESRVCLHESSKLKDIDLYKKNFFVSTILTIIFLIIMLIIYLNF